MLAADERERADKFGVNVALNDLRRDGRRSQAEFFADERFDARSEDARWSRPRRKVCRPRRFWRTISSRSQRAAKFVVHQGELQPEGSRLGVNPVAAADHRRELMFARAPCNRPCAGP